VAEFPNRASGAVAGNYKPTISCTLNTVSLGPAKPGSSLKVTLETGDDLVCTFKNTRM
jgi:hypothetical protein